MEKKTISVFTKDKKIIKLDQRIIEYSSVFKNAIETEEINVSMIDSTTLDFIYNFYKKFKFKPPPFTKEVTSSDLKAVLGPLYYEIFVPFVINEKIIDLDKIKPIIDGCYFYDFKELKDLCLMAIGSSFYFHGADIKEFKERWKDDGKTITSSERLTLIMNYENIFKKLLENCLRE